MACSAFASVKVVVVPPLDDVDGGGSDDGDGGSTGGRLRTNVPGWPTQACVCGDIICGLESEQTIARCSKL